MPGEPTIPQTNPKEQGAEAVEDKLLQFGFSKDEIAKIQFEHEIVSVREFDMRGTPMMTIKTNKEKELTFRRMESDILDPQTFKKTGIEVKISEVFSRGKHQ